MVPFSRLTACFLVSLGKSTTGGLAQILKELATGEQGVDAYLVELVYDALWWLKRSSELKAALVADEMAKHLARVFGETRKDPDYFGTEIFD